MHSEKALLEDPWYGPNMSAWLLICGRPWLLPLDLSVTRQFDFKDFLLRLRGVVTAREEGMDRRQINPVTMDFSVIHIISSLAGQPHWVKNKTCQGNSHECRTKKYSPSVTQEPKQTRHKWTSKFKWNKLHTVFVSIPHYISNNNWMKQDEMKSGKYSEKWKYCMTNLTEWQPNSFQLLLKHLWVLLNLDHTM